MQVTVRVPAALRELSDHQALVTVDTDGSGGTTVQAVLDALRLAFPALERRVRDEQGRTREHVNLFVGPDNVRDLDGQASVIGSGEELSIIPAISGG